MLNELGEDLKYLLLAGIGAVATTAEKSKDVVEDLVKKGQLTVSQGKVLNEELKHNLKKKGEQAAEKLGEQAEKVAEKLGKKSSLSAQTVLDSLDSMSEEELAAIRQKLQEMENGHGCEGECGQPSDDECAG